MSYLFIVSAIIVVLVLILVKEKKSSEGYKSCICSSNSGGAGKVCRDVVDINNNYVSGVATEFSALPNKEWSTSSPGDFSWPSPSGCNCKSNSDDGWAGAWDFDQLSN